ncbi:MAG: hypothetical protein ABI253_11420 [Mycobacterium sp.]
MEHLAQRCATVAAAAVTVGGLIAALTPMTQSPPDLQIRDFDLAAVRNVDTGPAVEMVENHVRADLAGAGDPETQQISLGDLLLGRGLGSLDGVTDPSSNSSDLMIDEQALATLLGGGFDPQALQDAGLSIEPLEWGAVGGVAPSVGAFGGTDQAASSAAASVVTGIAMLAQGFPAMQQALGAAVTAVEQEFNSSLVAAQEAAAERLFGDNPEVNDVVNWIYSVNNTLLAQNESAFNSLFGVTFDTQGSLLGHLDPGLAEAGWSTLLGFSPDDFNEIVNALQADNISLLGSIDWASLFSGLF